MLLEQFALTSTHFSGYATCTLECRFGLQGEFGDTFFMIKSGRVVCTDAGVGGKKMEDMRIGAGGHFGERALLLAAPRAANVTAEEEVRRFLFDVVWCVTSDVKRDAYTSPSVHPVVRAPNCTTADDLLRAGPQGIQRAAWPAAHHLGE